MPRFALSALILMASCQGNNDAKQQAKGWEMGCFGLKYEIDPGQSLSSIPKVKIGLSLADEASCIVYKTDVPILYSCAADTLYLHVEQAKIIPGILALSGFYVKQINTDPQKLIDMKKKHQSLGLKVIY